LKEAIRRGQIVTVHRGSDGTHPTLVVEKVEDPADAGSSLTLDALKDVTAPASTAAGMFLGTTGVGAWGPVANPLTAHLAAADPHAQYALRGRIGNLLTANQASGTDALGTTEGFRSTAATMTSEVAGGSRALKVVGTAATTVRAHIGGGTGTTPTGVIPVTAGALYTFVVTGTAPSVTAQPTLVIYWWRADGTTAATPASSSITGAPLSPTGSQYVFSDAAPPDAAMASVTFRWLAVAAGETVYLDRLGFWEGAGGDWAMPGTPILNQGRRVSRPNGTDRLVEVWGDGKWLVVEYDSGTRDVGGAKLRRVNAQVFKTGTPTLPAGFRDTWATGGNVFPTDDPIPTALPGTLVTTAQ
jgi:hypothetical protein